MSVMTIETHKSIVRKIKKRAFIIQCVLFVLLVISMVFPWLSKLEISLIRESYGVVKHHLIELKSKYALLEILRSKPLSVGQAIDIADAISSQREIEPSLILAIMDVESNFNPYAVSPKGAKGLLQAMPLIAKTYAGEFSRNIKDPIININACVQYLADLRKIYKDDWTKILRVYNGGPGNVNNEELDGYVRAVKRKWNEYGRNKTM